MRPGRLNGSPSPFSARALCGPLALATRAFSAFRTALVVASHRRARPRRFALILHLAATPRVAAFLARREIRRLEVASCRTSRRRSASAILGGAIIQLEATRDRQAHSVGPRSLRCTTLKRPSPSPPITLIPRARARTPSRHFLRPLRSRRSFSPLSSHARASALPRGTLARLALALCSL